MGLRVSVSDIGRMQITFLFLLQWPPSVSSADRRHNVSLDSFHEFQAITERVLGVTSHYTFFFAIRVRCPFYAMKL